MADIPSLYRVTVQVSGIEKGVELYARRLDTEGEEFHAEFARFAEEEKFT